MFTLVWVLRVAVRHDHLAEGKAVEDGPVLSFDFIEILDVVQDDAFTVVEAYVNVPVLPVDDTVVDLEAYAFGLRDVYGLEVGPEASFCFNGCWVVVVWWCLVNRSPDFWYVDVDDLLFVGVKYRAEIERIGILRIIHVGSVVHQSLL